jgi:hypothetical protein
VQTGAYDLVVGGFRKIGFTKVGFGDRVESDEGFTVQLISRASYPEVTIRYQEGPRTMDVFAEALARRRSLALDRGSMAGWEPPFAEEKVDDATRQVVLDRILAAMSFAGYIIEPEGKFPAVRNQIEGKVALKKTVKRLLDQAKLLDQAQRQQ